MEVTSFASATRIVIAVNRITALRPLCDSNTKFWSLLKHSYKGITVFSVCYALYAVYLYEFFEDRMRVGQSIYLFLRIVNCVCFLCIHVFNCRHSKEIPELNRKIADLEENTTKLGIVINYRIILSWIITTYSVTCLNVSLLYGLCGYWFWNSHFMMQQILFNYIANIGGQVHLDYLTYVCWLRCSFKQTNELLRKFLVDGRQINAMDTAEARTNRETVKKCLNKWTPQYSVRRTQVAPFRKFPSVKQKLQAVKKVHTLHEIRCVHLHLCGIMKAVNSVFDSQLGCHSFVAVINLVGILFFVYVQFQNSNMTLFVVGTGLIKVIDCLYVWMKIFIVSHVCEYTAKEMRKIVEIIHQCSISDFDTELKDEILQFSLQLSLNQIGKTHFDFFSLNFNFVRQCVSSITTYLVILIQWTQNMETEDPPLILNASNVTRT